jgi:class 3 adenylate cyclase
MGMDIELAILFADVVDSTKHYERLGDLAARDKIGTCIDLMRAATDLNRGTLVNTMGDGVMAAFPGVSEAASAAKHMLQEIAGHPQLRVDGRPMAIRVGFHVGPVVRTKRDVNGSTVNVAARVMNEAKGGQIMATEAAVRELSYDWRSHRIGPVQLKGVANEVVLHEVLWKDVDVTVAGPTPFDLKLLPVRAQLRLCMGDREFVIDEHTRSVQIGRDEQNDWVVMGEGISRWHAQIEIRSNKFVLTDKSRNGTFVQVDGKDDHVWRESVPLNGEGLIGLGRLPDEDSPQTIRFVCEERWAESVHV